MIRKNEWQNVRTWVHSLADVQIVLYCKEIKRFVENEEMRSLVIWNDAVRFQKLLHEECVERLRFTLPEEDR